MNAAIERALSAMAAPPVALYAPHLITNIYSFDSIYVCIYLFLYSFIFNISLHCLYIFFHRQALTLILIVCDFCYLLIIAYALSICALIARH